MKGQMGLILERGQELGEIDEALAATLRGEGKTLLIEGSAGAGKTALLAATATEAERAGFMVLSAAGRKLEHDFAFGVVTQLFSPLLESQSETRRAELFDGAAALAEPLFDPELAPGERFPLLHGLHWLCANLAAGGPVLLAVDDAHWADESTLAFLSYLAPRIAELGLCLAVGIRSHETEEGTQLSGALAGADALLLRPEPLSEAAVIELLRERLGSGHDGLAAECARATGGNPLFLRQLIGSLTVAGIEGGDLVASAAQVSVGRIVLARLSDLREPEVAVARAIAVLGDDPDADLITMLSGVGAADGGSGDRSPRRDRPARPGTTAALRAPTRRPGDLRVDSCSGPISRPSAGRAGARRGSEPL